MTALTLEEQQWLDQLFTRLQERISALEHTSIKHDAILDTLQDDLLSTKRDLAGHFHAS